MAQGPGRRRHGAVTDEVSVDCRRAVATSRRCAQVIHSSLNTGAQTRDMHQESSPDTHASAKVACGPVLLGMYFSHAPGGHTLTAVWFSSSVLCTRDARCLRSPPRLSTRLHTTVVNKPYTTDRQRASSLGRTGTAEQHPTRQRPINSTHHPRRPATPRPDRAHRKRSFARSVELEARRACQRSCCSMWLYCVSLL